MSRAFRIDNWKKTLQSHDFKLDSAVPAAFSRMSGPFKLMILKSKRISEKGDVFIMLSIIGPDRFREEPLDAVFLTSFLRRTKAPIMEEDGVGDAWNGDEGEEALRAAVKFGVPWLEEYGHATKLIDYISQRLKSGIAPPSKWEPPPPFETIWMPVPTQSVHSSRHPPIYDNHLSQLYFEIGDWDLARVHAQRYLDAIRDMPSWAEEQDRANRLINAANEARGVKARRPPHSTG
jgi:hypothetical protein